jgi:carbon-monoxide dehydrogenase small subunit
MTMMNAKRKELIQITVNGRLWEAEVEPRRLLVDFLRDDLGLLGTKKACQDSYCGSCTVLLDGKTVHSCTVLAIMAKNHEVTTVEGLASNGDLHPIQQAFVDYGAPQCGFCIPGMIMAAKALLAEKPHPSEAEVRHYLTGNLCRCTGYTKIIEAILAVAPQNP